MSITTIPPAQALSHNELLMLAAAYSELLAAARASVAAATLGEGDPLVYVREHLADHGQVPPVGARPVVLLAQSAVLSMHRAEVS
ncbi:hypothetical protein [Nonomuraea gerenzanensis]|uniref:Uncharacterized protein n=1 Tax=Nonomuraea gerenzanensis TaxID=93944 RepID=A0A1M4BLE1_9ACTN|nr:hypothetical protein [Nonomuraea gerenzanensis]UBU19188.1 hypothetical protein LCN96_56310 [Nonomuraea gerenzanensis]SAP16363.1 hypothetical protein BN4615_P11026 [Nonomuraea gerenzanensis]